MRLILASASPRRKKLLARIDIEPDAIDPGNIDESPHARELPRDYAVRMAAEKAALVAPRHAGSLILAVDTVVAAGRRILPKTENEANARTCLSLLSGRRHRVLSAVTLIDEKGRPHQKLSTTIVMFKRLTKGEIAAYIARGEWRGRAGCYAIQGFAESWIRFLSGSHSGVIGLPLHETRTLLESAGYPFD